MRAFVLEGHGDMEKLVYHENWPVPTVGKNDVLIKVHACGLNNTDVNTRTAWYSKGVTENTTGSAFDGANDEDGTWGGAPVTFPRIQGADVCGTVVAAGENADASMVGKRVMIDGWIRDWDDPDNHDKCGYYGSECDGGFAEYTKVDQRQSHVIDSKLDHVEIATFMTAYMTAENMLARASVEEGDIVLVTGASGGVGSALVQLANRRGATTIALASESKHEGMQHLQADHLLPRNPAPLKAALQGTIGRPDVDVVADVVGGDYFSQLIASLVRGGRYTCAGAIAGPMVEFDLRTFYLNDLTFTGATVLPAGLFADVVRYIAQDEVKPLVGAVYPLEELHRAQQAFIDKKHVGNIVVTI